MPKKSKKGSKPEWMSDEVYAISQNPAQLVEAFSPAAEKTGNERVVMRDQAGMLLLQLLWPSDKKTQAKRSEALKAGILEVSVKMLSLPSDKRAVPAAGLLALFAAGADADRESVMTARPSALTSAQRLLSASSPTLVATVCSLLRALATAADSRARVLRAFREADWKPLLAACAMPRATGALGGRSAAVDGAQTVAALLGPPLSEDEATAAQERSLAEACHAPFVAAGGIAAMVRLAGGTGHPAAIAAAAAALHATFRAGGAAVRTPFEAAGGVPAMVRVLGNAYVELPQRAAAAGNIWNYLVPDKRVGPPHESTDVTLKRTQQKIAAKESSAKAPPITMQGCDGEDGSAVTLEEGLTAAERDAVLARCGAVVAAGGVPALLALCCGPEGPLPEVSGDGDAPKQSGSKKGKKGKKGKKDKGEPGMAEAQAFATGCLRLISIDDAHKAAVAAAGAPRYLAPLLDSRNNLARWHARQTLLNLSMINEFAREQARYGVPAYVTGENVPALHRVHRPQSNPGPPGPLMKAGALSAAA